MPDTTVEAVRVPSETSDPPIKNEFLKLVIGGLGGITPVIVTLLASNHQSAEIFDPNYFIGVGIRAAGLFCLGALIVWLHQAVRTRNAVFQLGVAAPALVTAMVQSSTSHAADFPVALTYGASEVRVAQIENAKAKIVMSDMQPPTIVFGKCTIVDGILGRKCKK